MLAFSLKYGDNADKIIKAALEEGDEVPEQLLNMPDIKPEYDFYWHCFINLMGDRPCESTGILPIPWTSIYTYCKAFNLSMDVISDVFYVVHKVDGYYCDKINSDNAKKIKKNGNKRL